MIIYICKRNGIFQRGETGFVVLIIKVDNPRAPKKAKTTLRPEPWRRWLLYDPKWTVGRMEISYASPSAPNLSESDNSMSSSTRPVKIIPLQHPDTTSTSTSFSGSYPSALFSRWTLKFQRLTWAEWIGLFLPCYRWISTYKWREYLQVDLMAGTTVGIMLVPQVILLSSISFFFLLTATGFRKKLILVLLLSPLCLVVGKSDEKKEKNWIYVVSVSESYRTQLN